MPPNYFGLMIAQLSSERVKQLNERVSRILERSMYDIDRPVGTYSVDSGTQDNWEMNVRAAQPLSGEAVITVDALFDLLNLKEKETHLQRLMFETLESFPDFSVNINRNITSMASAEISRRLILDESEKSEEKAEVLQRNVDRIVRTPVDIIGSCPELDYAKQLRVEVLYKPRKEEPKQILKASLVRKRAKPVYEPEKEGESAKEVLDYYSNTEVSRLLLHQLTYKGNSPRSAMLETARYDPKTKSWILVVRRTDKRKVDKFWAENNRRPIQEEKRKLYYRPSAVEDIIYAVTNMGAQGFVGEVHPFHDKESPYSLSIDVDVPSYFTKNDRFLDVEHLNYSLQRHFKEMGAKYDFDFSGGRGFHYDIPFKPKIPDNWISFKSQDEIAKMDDREKMWQMMRDFGGAWMLGFAREFDIDYVSLEPKKYDRITLDTSSMHSSGGLRTRLSLHPRSGYVKIPLTENPQSWEELHNLSTIDAVKRDVRKNEPVYLHHAIQNESPLPEMILNKYGHLIPDYQQAKFLYGDERLFFGRI